MKDSEQTSQGVVRFQRLYRDAPDIRVAERSALGAMPTAAFQYCEAMRTASAYGFYVYPPKDLSLFFDGKEALFHEDDQWYPMKSANFEDGFRKEWAAAAPEDLSDMDPPYLSELFVPGLVQIWSGYLVSTEPGWALSLKPPVNYDTRSSFSVFEGLVETDTFKPMPLFINIRLQATNREIFIPKDKPLFQVQQVPREAYQRQANLLNIIEGFDDVDWDGIRGTTRKARPGPGDPYEPGRYAKFARRRD